MSTGWAEEARPRKPLYSQARFKLAGVQFFYWLLDISSLVHESVIYSSLARVRDLKVYITWHGVVDIGWLEG